MGDSDIVEQIVFKAETFTNKSSVLFGVSGSGKTTTLKQILEVLNDECPQIMVICPSEPQNNTYGKFIPSPVIHYKFDIKLLDDIYERNALLTSIYRKANDVKTLEGLFNKVNDSTGRSIVTKINDLKNSNIQKTHDKFIDISKISSETKKINDTTEKMLIQVYKLFIGKHKRDLKDEKRFKLSDDEKYAIKYLKLNPNMIVIMDDCSESLANLKKDDIEIMSKYMMRGRHASMTTFICVHMDKQLKKELRLNAFNLIFCDRVSFNGFFEYKENQCDIDLKKTAREVQKLLNEENQKLLFVREERKFYKYKITPGIVNRPFGNASLKKFCDKIKKKSGGIDTTSKYFNIFNINKK